MPSCLPNNKIEQLITAAYQCCTEIGLVSGVFNVEMKMTPTGPKLIEINARMGGYYLRDWIKDLWCGSNSMRLHDRLRNQTSDPEPHATIPDDGSDVRAIRPCANLQGHSDIRSHQRPTHLGPHPLQDHQGGYQRCGLLYWSTDM